MRRRRRQASLPVLVAVFGAFFGGLVLLAARGDDPPPRIDADELAAYEATILPVARQVGVGIVMGIRPDITDFRSGKLSAEVFRRDMVVRYQQFADADAVFARAPVPDALEDAARLFDEAFTRYRLAVVALHGAGESEGYDREALLSFGARVGDTGDATYDEAGRLVQRARRAAGLAPSPDWPDA